MFVRNMKIYNYLHILLHHCHEMSCIFDFEMLCIFDFEMSCIFDFESTFRKLLK